MKAPTFVHWCLEVRREMAEKYIANKTMPLAEISYMLGFSRYLLVFPRLQAVDGMILPPHSEALHA